MPLATDTESHERTDAHFVQAARDLIPLLREHAEETEQGRRLAPAVESALREAGLFQVCTPRASGGAGGNVRTLVEVSAEVARGDGSAGWVAFVANTGGWGSGLFSDEVRATVFRDPRSVIIGQYGPTGNGVKVDGGWLLNGTWPFASGCYQAQWTLNGFMAVGADGAPQGPRWALIDASHLKIEDSWYVAGGAGTGSNTFVGADVFVPDEFTFGYETFSGQVFTENVQETAYRAPVNTVACIGIVGPIWGMAEQAWDLVTDSLQAGRRIIYAHEDARDAPSYQLALARARTAIDTGRFHILHAADEIDAAAREGRVLTFDDRATLRSHAAAATRSFRAAVDDLVDVGGTRSFALSNPLQRTWRDVGIFSRHGLNNILLNEEFYGRTLAGREQQFTLSL